MDSARIRQRRLFSGLGLAIIAVLFVAVVVLSNALLRTERVDLTAERLYTLSPGTRNVLRQIDEPISLRFYFSGRLARELPSVGLYAQRVRDLLEEYSARAGGKIRLEVYDPEPFSPAEDRAVASGLQGVPVDQSGELVYFGLAGTNALDDREVIAFFDQSREPLLEYDLTRIVHNLANPEKPTVGLISSLPLAGTPYAARAGQDDSWIAYSQLTEFFEVEMLSSTVEEIPEKVRLLVLAHPKALSDKTLYAIDQFVLGGGQLLVFVDPHSEADATMPRPGMPPPGMTGSNLAKLFDAWGIEVPESVVVGDLAAARRVQVPTEGQQTRLAAVDYPLWMALTQANFNGDSPVVAQLSQINIASPGHILKKEDAPVELTPLIVTSNRAGTVDAAMLQGPADPLRIANRFEPSNRSYILAARVHGTVPSAFPEGPPQPAEDKPEASAASEQQPKPEEKPAEAAPRPHLAEAAEPINAIVVADVDLLADGLWVRVQDFFGQRVAMPVANNGAFFINAVDNLSGSSDLIGLRSRGVAQRPFTEIRELQRQAERRFRAKEQELLAKLKETEEKLRTIQGREGAEGQVVLTAEQRETIENFREEAVRVRRELRDVQHALRRDVESLTSWIEAINIGLIPLLVAVAAVGVAMVRRRYRRRPRLA